MEYVSTRGQSPTVDGATAIWHGIAPDGGLYVPQQLPQLKLTDLNPSYQSLAQAVLHPFLPEYGLDTLTQAIAKAYANFNHPAVVPVRVVGPYAFLELWHGPTCAFKDLALQLLPHLLTHAAAQRPVQECVILVATSGDTGKAALAGFADVPGTRLIVFYPDKGVSPIQERQMLTQAGANVDVVAVAGNFDDAQQAVKSVFTDPDFNRQLAASGRTFSSANSINWGRLVPQIVYYFSAYLALAQQGKIELGAPINVVVPTGNFGNILAAYYAKHMGLPVARLICASNSNNVLTDFIREGYYDRNRPFYRTISPSMDILLSSNLERLLFALSDRDPGQVRQWMQALSKKGRYELAPDLLSRLQAEFWGGYASEDDTKRVIATTYRDYGYVLDPHTAVAVHVYQQYRAQSGDERPALIAATASPFKFPQSVAQALWGYAVAAEEEFALMELLAERTGLDIPLGLRDLQTKPLLHNLRCERHGVAQAVAQILGL